MFTIVDTDTTIRTGRRKTIDRVQAVKKVARHDGPTLYICEADGGYILVAPEGIRFQNASPTVGEALERAVDYLNEL